MKRLVRGAARAMGFDVVRYQPQTDDDLPPDILDDDRTVLGQIRGFTMTSIERQLAVIHAARYVVRRDLSGCFVECGVWRGGSSMAAALTFAQENATDRSLYLYDTFEGMTPPTDADRSVSGAKAQTLLDNDVDRTGAWCVADIEDVQRNLASTKYPTDRLHLIKGPVESTIPEQSPAESIALLRLDTDWYESTLHELVHLFPRVVEGGIVIIDDYGHWSGARQAVDEYLAQQPRQYYMHRIDYTGRLLIKQ